MQYFLRIVFHLTLDRQTDITCTDHSNLYFEKQFVKNGRFTNFWFMGSINLLVILESRTLKNFLPTLNALNNYLPQPLLQSPHYPSPYFQ